MLLLVFLDVGASPHDLLTSSSNIPGWIAPSVVASLLGTAANFCWNIVNTLRANSFRARDHFKAEFNLSVGAPIEAALGKFASFAAEVMVLRREIEAHQMTPMERVAKFNEMQKVNFAPAQSQLSIAISAAMRCQMPDKTIDWFAFEDHLDPILNAFDTLCRQEVPEDRIYGALQNMIDGVDAACISIRAALRAQLNRYL